MSLVPEAYRTPTIALYRDPIVAHGSFSSTQIQVVPAGVASPVTYDTEDITPVGMTLSSPSSIRIGIPGLYKVLASAQCNKTTVGFGDLEMFPQINLTPVPNSSTRIQLNQNTELVMTVEWLLQLNTGDELFINLFSPVVGLELLAIPASVSIPAIPSIITTVVRIA